MAISTSSFFLKSFFESGLAGLCKGLMRSMFSSGPSRRQLRLVAAEGRRKRLKPHSASHRVRAVVLRSHDGTRLHGWLMTPRWPEPKGAVLYFSNGSEEALWLASQAPAMFPEMTVLVMHYRAAKEGEKRPAEEDLVADGEMLFDWLADSHRHLASFPISVMGRDFGAGVAVKVAASRPAAALALLAPCGLQPVERNRLPVLRNRNAGTIRQAISFRHPTPVLVLRAQSDGIVAKEKTDAFVARLPARVLDKTIAGADYHDLPYRAELQDAIASFLREHLAPVNTTPVANDTEESPALALVA